MGVRILKLPGPSGAPWGLPALGASASFRPPGLSRLTRRGLWRSVLRVTRYEYDEEASAASHMDVVHEVEETAPASASRWVEAMRRLNGIDDALARRLLALHRDCGSGSGVCDDLDADPEPITHCTGWGCETTALIADHYGVEYPAALQHEA